MHIHLLYILLYPGESLAPGRPPPSFGNQKYGRGGIFHVVKRNISHISFCDHVTKPRIMHPMYVKKKLCHSISPARGQVHEVGAQLPTMSQQSFGSRVPCRLCAKIYHVEPIPDMQNFIPFVAGCPSRTTFFGKPPREHIPNPKSKSEN